jgi:5-dehydro-4-deoxyglucarate dehydratase
MARNAEEAGADAILVFPPPGGPQTLEGQRRYFREIVRSVSIGVLIYPRTQKDDWGRLLEELADLPNIMGFKDGSRGIALGRSLSPQTRERLVWTARGEEHALQALPAGAAAYATSFASLAPGACHEFFRRGTGGDAKGMEKLFRKRIAPLDAIRRQLPLPDRSPGFGVAAIKAALESLGRAGGSVRPPKLQVGGTARIAEIAARYSELTEA